jgi:hypothetical protein
MDFLLPYEASTDLAPYVPYNMTVCFWPLSILTSSATISILFASNTDVFCSKIDDNKDRWCPDRHARAIILQQKEF